MGRGWRQGTNRGHGTPRHQRSHSVIGRCRPDGHAQFVQCIVGWEGRMALRAGVGKQHRVIRSEAAESLLCGRMHRPCWLALLWRQKRSNSRQVMSHSCHIPKMTELEPAIQPFRVRGDVRMVHMRQERIDFDPACTTRNMMQMRHSQHSRQVEPHCSGKLSGDLAGPLAEALDGEKNFFVRVKRNTRMGFVACMKDKNSGTESDAFSLISRMTCTKSGGVPRLW